MKLRLSLLLSPTFLSLFSNICKVLKIKRVQIYFKGVHFLNIVYKTFLALLWRSHGHSCDRDRFLSENHHFAIPTLQNKGIVYNDTY